MLPARGVRAGVDRVEADRELIELARNLLFSGRLVLALKGCRPSLIEGDIERGAESMAVISRSSAESVDGTLAILRDAEAKAARVAVAAGFVEAGVNRCCRTEPSTRAERRYPRWYSSGWSIWARRSGAQAVARRTTQFVPSKSAAPRLDCRGFTACGNARWDGARR